MQVLSCQKAPKIFVGDSHQQIYRFRGAVDAMKQVEAVQTLRLSQSFRFGARPFHLQ
jgi:F-box protein, helicase, 18